ncbi:MAG: cupin domain-containing protein [Actinomycetota bacterium]
MDEQIRVVSSASREAWRALVDPPGDIPSPGAELEVLASADARYSTGLWEREPDTWSFERPYHEVAVILEGEADIETPDGTVHTVRAGDVLVTPKGLQGHVADPEEAREVLRDLRRARGLSPRG